MHADPGAVPQRCRWCRELPTQHTSSITPGSAAAPTAPAQPSGHRALLLLLPGGLRPGGWSRQSRRTRSLQPSPLRPPLATCPSPSSLQLVLWLPTPAALPCGHTSYGLWAKGTTTVHAAQLLLQDKSQKNASLTPEGSASSCRRNQLRWGLSPEQNIAGRHRRPTGGACSSSAGEQLW